EESYGCLVGTHARDKDAVVAVMALCEAAAYYKEKGLTLWDQMLNIYEKYGYYKEDLVSITMKGVDGAERIRKILADMRSNPAKIIGAYKVIALRDYEADTRLELASGKVTSTGLPKSNVLYYELEGGAWCCVRPSGTEPKVKFYMGVREGSLETAEKALKELKNAMTEMVK
ncbi:MAG: phospho-sugar mutase, partial [Lachnospiraceae bacterium]|nr:phospho-sugar mutase [Lachnospiraceae bacterium]